jgi:hypothetical protein
MNNAIIPVVQLQLDKLMIGISYDVNIDKLAAASQRRGGFELFFPTGIFSIKTRVSADRHYAPDSIVNGVYYFICSHLF